MSLASKIRSKKKQVVQIATKESIGLTTIHWTVINHRNVSDTEFDHNETE
jgi:hypothetical protein